MPKMSHPRPESDCGGCAADPTYHSTSVAGVPTLAEALGHDADTRLLILSADLVGSTHAATAAGIHALQEGLATTATLMMPGPWARHAADRFTASPNLDVGIHLTLNAELEDFRWAPLTHAPSLLDGDGGFPRTPADLWDHADGDVNPFAVRARANSSPTSGRGSPVIKRRS